MIKKLNLGCGGDIMEGYINVDSLKLNGVDIVHNLNKFPWPFKNNTFEEVIMKSVLEHVDNPIKTLKEVIRIGSNNSSITIIVPYAHSLAAVTDIQHKTHFTENSFSEELLREYDLQELKLEKRQFLYKNLWKRYIPFKRILNVFLNGIYDDLLFEFKITKKS